MPPKAKKRKLALKKALNIFNTFLNSEDTV